MNRLQALQEKIDELYKARHQGRADWADYLYSHHIFTVAEQAGILAERLGANKEIAMAAAMLHDIADAVIKRKDPEHAKESATIARRLLLKTGFTAEEIALVVEDAIGRHSCHGNECPVSREGQVMATADALVHLQSDFYDFAEKEMVRQGVPATRIKRWALEKIERDFRKKILFEEARQEVQLAYERLKAHFMALD